MYAIIFRDHATRSLTSAETKIVQRTDSIITRVSTLRHALKGNLEAIDAAGIIISDHEWRSLADSELDALLDLQDVMLYQVRLLEERLRAADEWSDIAPSERT